MAHLWVKDTFGEWAVVMLGLKRLDLDDRILQGAGWSTEARLRRRVMDRMLKPPGASLVRSDQDDHESWVLTAFPGRVTVNGVRVASGLHVLADRDEITVAGYEPVFFSTERLAAIEKCPASDRALTCPRCRQVIAPYTPAVCCPACGVWHHQDGDLKCWTYAERCALCPHPTGLDAGYQWTPEDL